MKCALIQHPLRISIICLTFSLSRDGYGVGCNGRSSRSGRFSSTGSPALEEDGIFLNSTNSKLLERAQGILM